MNSKSIVFSIALIFALVDFGSCLECFHCDTFAGNPCTLSFPPFTPKLECNTLSSKVIQDVILGKLPVDVFDGLDLQTFYCTTIVFENCLLLQKFLTCMPGVIGDKEATCKRLIEATKNFPTCSIKSCISELIV